MVCRNQIRTTPAVPNHLLAYGCLDAARLLIVEGHIDVNQRDASGLALHVACGPGRGGASSRLRKETATRGPIMRMWRRLPP